MTVIEDGVAVVAGDVLRPLGARARFQLARHLDHRPSEPRASEQALR
jgi:hypothetical protein